MAVLVGRRVLSCVLLVLWLRLLKKVVLFCLSLALGQVAIFLRFVSGFIVVFSLVFFIFSEFSIVKLALVYNRNISFKYCKVP